MADGAPFYVLSNFETDRNCTLTATYPAVVTIEGINVGEHKDVSYDVS
jgi:hypothetical protein